MIDLLFPILIALVPVIIAVIGARIYGILHGFITYLFMGQLLIFCLAMFGGNIGAELAASTAVHAALHTKINSFVIASLKQIGLECLVSDEQTAKYVILGLFLLLFIVSQVVGCLFRKRSIEKTKKLKREARRY